MIYTDKKLIHADITYQIRRAAFNVYNTLGFDHKEQVYQKAIAREFEDIKLSYKKEESLEVKYKDKVVGHYRPDFIIGDKVILELKSVEFMPKSYNTQLIQYLKTTGFQVGLLINFGSPKLIIQRLVWTRQSA